MKSKQIRTRLYTSSTDGKAERLIHTSLSEWGYAFISATDVRSDQLAPQLRRYNF